MAGIIGINPDNLTMREIFWMFKGRDKQNFLYLSSILSMLVNVNCIKSSDRVTPEAFNPYAKNNANNNIKLSLNKNNFHLLKKIFCKG